MLSNRPKTRPSAAIAALLASAPSSSSWWSSSCVLGSIWRSIPSADHCLAPDTDRTAAGRPKWRSLPCWPCCERGVRQRCHQPADQPVYLQHTNRRPTAEPGHPLRPPVAALRGLAGAAMALLERDSLFKRLRSKPENKVRAVNDPNARCGALLARSSPWTSTGCPCASCSAASSQQAAPR